MQTEDLLKIAKWAVETTRKYIPVSSNLPDPKRAVSHRKLYLKLVRRKADKNNVLQTSLIKEVFAWNLNLLPDKERYPLNASAFFLKTYNNYFTFNEINNLLSELKSTTKSCQTPYEYIESSAVRALKYGIGNCGETSAYGFILLCEYPTKGLDGLPAIDKKIPIERVVFPNEDDHAFILINRDPQTKFNDALTWNDDTVICDPWTKEAYTKKQLFENKSEEEISCILTRISKMRLNDPCINDHYYLGAEYNTAVHSEHWYKKNPNPKKYWRPAYLREMKELPPKRENLPPYRMKCDKFYLSSLKKKYEVQYEEFILSKLTLEKSLQNFGNNEDINLGIEIGQLQTLYKIYQQKSKALKRMAAKYNSELNPDSEISPIVLESNHFNTSYETFFATIELIMEAKSNLKKIKRDFQELFTKIKDYGLLEHHIINLKRQYEGSFKKIKDFNETIMRLGFSLPEKIITPDKYINSLILYFEDLQHNKNLFDNTKARYEANLQQLENQLANEKNEILSTTYKNLQKDYAQGKILQDKLKAQYEYFNISNIAECSYFDEHAANFMLYEKRMKDKSNKNDNLTTFAISSPQLKTIVTDFKDRELRDEIEKKIAVHLSGYDSKVKEIQINLNFFNDLKRTIHDDPTPVTAQLLLARKMYHDRKTLSLNFYHLFAKDKEYEFINHLIDFSNKYISSPSPFNKLSQ